MGREVSYADGNCRLPSPTRINLEEPVRVASTTRINLAEEPVRVRVSPSVLDPLVVA